MGIFKGRQQVPFDYSAWGNTRYNGTVWHGGIDVVGLDDTTVRMPTYKGKILSGTVVTAQIVPRSSGNLTWEWGYYICVKLDANQTPDAVNYLYFCHNEKNLVTVGTKVKSGDALAIMGNTGNAALASPPIKHCHFEVRQAATGKGLDPTAYTMTDNKEGVYGADETQTAQVAAAVQALAKDAVTLRIGPASAGDRKTMRALAESLCLGYAEDETGRMCIGPASAGDQSTVLTKAAALGLAYGVYEPDATAQSDEVAKLAAELQEMAHQREEWEHQRKEMEQQRDEALAKAAAYLQKINAAKAALEG